MCHHIWPYTLGFLKNNSFTVEISVLSSNVILNGTACQPPSQSWDEGQREAGPSLLSIFISANYILIDLEIEMQKGPLFLNYLCNLIAMVYGSVLHFQDENPQGRLVTVLLLRTPQAMLALGDGWELLL